MHARRTAFLWVMVLFTAPAAAVERPKWMDEPGIVMAGNWEEPSFRARRMSRMDYRLPPEKLAEYAREHSDEILAELKELGVNFLMIHCYKGAGLQTEREGMEDSRRFARRARKVGMRVGTYVGGTMLYERLFREEPDAPQWQAVGPRGEPIFYNPSQQFRYATVRNHPGFIEYLKKPVRFAIEEIRADLIHFDNFGSGASSYDPFTRRQFAEYLKAQGKPAANPPVQTDPADPLVRAWTDYKCEVLAQHYAAMSQFIRTLNPQCGVECNPGGVHSDSAAIHGIDHARLLPLGNAFWDEDYGAEWSAEKRSARTRIRSLKAGQLFGNSTFLYCESPLDLAESMAFNVNCLGSVAWFEWGKVTTAHLTGKPIPPAMKTYVRFFLEHQDLFRHAKPVADVAVLRTFAEQGFGPRHFVKAEQALIQGHVAWRMIFDQQLDDLLQYRVIVRPEDQWLTASQQEKLQAFASRGGLVVPSVGIDQTSEFPMSLRPRLRVVAEAPSSVALELCQQENPRRVLVHLVNFDVEQPTGGIPLTLRLQDGHPGAARLLSPDPVQDEQLPGRFEGGEFHVTVPNLHVYAMLVIDGASL